MVRLRRVGGPLTELQDFCPVLERERPVMPSQLGPAHGDRPAPRSTPEQRSTMRVLGHDPDRRWRITTIATIARPWCASRACARAHARNDCYCGRARLWLGALARRGDRRPRGWL